MARPCSVCIHPKIAEINAALARPNCNQRELAATYGFSPFTLSRHKTLHVKTKIAKALERQALVEGASMILKAQRVQGIVEASLDHCATNGLHRDIAPLAGAYVKTGEHIARLAGLDGYRPAQSVTNVDARGSRILIMPQGEDPLALPPASNPVESQ